MPFPWGAAISAGGQILGGLLGGKKNKNPGLDAAGEYNAWWNRHRIRETVKDAREAGIHPLVALGSNTGGFPVFSSGQSGGFDTGSAIAGGIDAFGQLYQQDADARDAERVRREDIARDDSRYDDARFQRILDDQAQSKRDTLQERLVEAQIMESRSRTMLDMARARAVGAQGSGNPSTLTDALGIKLTPPAGRASAQDMQDQYGDIVENVYGVGNWFQDMWSGASPEWWPRSVQLPRGSTGPRPGTRFNPGQ